MLDAVDYGVPADEDADDGDEADPEKGFRRVGLRGIPCFDFLKQLHQQAKLMKNWKIAFFSLTLLVN